MVSETSINKQYKDRLFKLVFRDKKDLLQLYNAVNHTSYDNPEDIEVNTMEDVIYMGMKNDISFLIHSVLNLYEHQSTFSPNFPLRGLFYFADIYRKMVTKNGDLYSSRQIKLPVPQFIVFYNGLVNAPEEQTLYLHDAFKVGSEDREFLAADIAVDCRATVLNINVGHNKELMKQCRKLEEYSIFIGRVRNYQKTTKDILSAINLAVDECIENGILADILRDNREEVCAMLLREYNEQAHIDSEKQIAMEEGERKGEERVNQLNILLAEQGRAEDIIKAAQDKEYQNKLFEEFNL
uniref:hypothetical protein n=1 Tax=Acetatifactor sp. TaxID=1872090 RepID=UPI00405788B3